MAATTQGVTVGGWPTMSNPVEMLRAVAGRCSCRKGRLLVCGIVRAVADRPFDTPDPDIRDTDAHLAAGLGGGDTDEIPLSGSLEDTAEAPALRPASFHTFADEEVMAILRPLMECEPGREIESLIDFDLACFGPSNDATYARLIRCVLGNPVEPVALDPNWRTPAVLNLARRIYDRRRFAELPLLADALEAAGCDNPEVLAHCREGAAGDGLPAAQRHVRGCWVVDLLLKRG